MNELNSIFSEFFRSILQVLPNILAGVVVLVFFFFVGYAVESVINRRLKNKWKDVLVARFFGGIVRWGFFTLGIVFALHLIGFGGIASSILAGAGVSAIIIGFAFKDIAENFLAGILLAVNRPFKMGDIIQTDSFKGPVRELSLRTTQIRTIDGRDIYIPNSLIIKNVLINYTADNLIRHEFMVGLDTNDDLEKARNLVLGYFEDQPEVLKKPSPNLLVEEIGESSVNVKILFWVDMVKLKLQKEMADTGETVKSMVMRDIKELLLANGFNLPSVIVEHKMYQENHPLAVKMSD